MSILRKIGFGMTPSKTELGKFIRARRLELGMTQTKLAKIAGISQALLSAREIRAYKYLKSREGIKGLAEALRCDPSEIQARIPKKQPRTQLGKLIYSRREALGLTVCELAQRMGTKPRTIYELEGKGRQGISYPMRERLAKALGLDPSVFKDFVDKRERETRSTLGQLIRSRRKELGLAQEQLAKKLEATRQCISLVELGQTPLSRGSCKGNLTLEKLAKVLKLDIATLKELRPKRALKQKIAELTSLGGFLTARRLKLGLTLREVAERAEISGGYLSRIEGNTAHPSFKILGRLAKALECEIPPELIPAPRERKPGREK